MAKKKSSSSKAVKKATKTLTKTAKKNPVAVIIIIVVALCLVGAGVAGYFIWKSMNPDMSFELKGREKTYVSLGGTYVEEGAIAKYAGKDVSSEIKITYYVINHIKVNN